MTTIVRKATSEDIPSIHKVDASFNSSFHTKDKHLMDDISLGNLFVAVIDNEVVGYARLGKLWDEIPLLVVSRIKPEYRRQKIGTKLFETRKKECIKRGHEYLLSSTDVTNKGSIAYHKKMGFEEIGRMQIFPNEPEEIFYRLNLKN